jgi:hypothetical protein
MARLAELVQDARQRGAILSNEWSSPKASRQIISLSRVRLALVEAAVCVLQPSPCSI